MENLSFLGVLVVMIMTPFAPAAPYIAVLDAPLRTSIDAMSLGLSSSYEPSMPSIMNSGLLSPFIERTPRRFMFTPEPASPLDLVMSRPATCPCIASMTLLVGMRTMSSAFTDETAPVRSRFFIVP